MRAIVQRVRWAEVEVEPPAAAPGVPGPIVGKIGQGLLVYLGVAAGDGQAEAEYLAEKVANLRVFDDEHGKLNRSVQDVRGGILAVPNFTLLADARKGRRPEFTGAARGADARPLHDMFVSALQRRGCQVACGAFGESMIVRSAAEGPVNIIIESPGTPTGKEKTT